MNHQKFWSGFCRRFRSKNADFKTLLKELENNLPCSKKWFKRETWEMDNAILIYNNIDIEKLRRQETISQREIIEVIKFSDEDDLYRNLFNYLNSHHSPFDFDHINTISVSSPESYFQHLVLHLTSFKHKFNDCLCKGWHT